jgi:hypothetical protein
LSDFGCSSKSKKTAMTRRQWQARWSRAGTIVLDTPRIIVLTAIFTQHLPVHVSGTGLGIPFRRINQPQKAHHGKDAVEKFAAIFSANPRAPRQRDHFEYRTILPIVQGDFFCDY